MSPRRFLILFFVFALLQGAPSSAQNAFLGKWTVVDAHVGPWYDGHGANPDIDSKLVHATIVFGKGRVTGAPQVECNKVRYTVSTIGPEDLFQGVLKNPAKDAAALGFKGDKITSINEGCIRSDADLEMDFAMIDKDTMVFGLNNVVYKMMRAGQ